MLKFGNKEFRNLQEQVRKNMLDLANLKESGVILDEFGIKVIGQATSVGSMPSVADYKEDNPDWEYGDAYAVGTESPYELYILTRANELHANDYWFNIGEFPAIGPEGPEGPQGEQGPQGPTGPSGQDGVSPEFSIGDVSATTLSAGESATASVTQSGTYAQPILNFELGIPQGQDGSTLTSVAWGSIYGSIDDQTDLITLVQGRVKKVTTSTAYNRVYGIDNNGNQVTWNMGSDIITPANLSGYAQTDVANIFTKSQNMLSAITFQASSVDFVKNDGENFYSYVLPYATGTIALSENFGGSYSGSYWTSIKINGTTKLIGQGGGGGPATWGSITGDIDDQLDLMSKFSEYATVTSLSSAVSDIGSIISSLDYASVGALSSGTVIPDLTGYAKESWVSSNFLSSGALSGYATETYVLNQLSDYATISSLSIYAQTSSLASVAFTGNYSDLNGLPTIPSDTGDLTNGAGFITSSALTPYATVSALSSAVSDITSVISSLDYASVGALSSNTYIPDITGLASEGYVNSSISALSSIYAPISDYASTSYVNNAISSLSSIYASISYVDSLSSIYASQSDLSLYAKLSTSNTFASSNYFQEYVYVRSPDAIAGPRLCLGNTYGNQIGYLQASGSTFVIYGSSINLSGSAYYNGNQLATTNQIPSIPASLPANGGTASYVSGFNLEVWTFTLSDNTSVSKTVLVG